MSHKIIELATFQSAADLDRLVEVASGASLKIVQLERGNIHTAIAHVELGRSSVQFILISARGRGPVSDERWTFLVFPGFLGRPEP